MTRKNKLSYLNLVESTGPRAGKTTTYVYRNVTQLAKDTFPNVLVAYQFVGVTFETDAQDKVISHKLSMLDNNHLDVNDDYVVVKQKDGDIVIYDEYVDLPRRINETNKYENMLYKLFN